jgi:hypothetical protein
MAGALTWAVYCVVLLGIRAGPLDPVPTVYDVLLATVVGAGFGAVMWLPRTRGTRRRPWRAVLVLIAVVGFASLPLIPPAPGPPHPFRLGTGSAHALGTRLPAHPISTVFTMRAWPQAIQIAPDGRTLHVMYGTGVCSSLAWATATPTGSDVYAVRTRESSHPILAACPAIALTAATAIPIDPALDPAAPPAFVDEDGRPIELQPYQE